MMRTRCPNCSTIFRITAEQLRVRFGMVRCGQCQAVFNAFDTLVEGSSEAAGPQPDQSPTVNSAADQAVAQKSPETLTRVQPEQPKAQELPPPQVKPVEQPEAPAKPRQDPIDAALAAEETPEQSAKAARDAGLMAVRELSETPGYDRWSAGAVESGGGEEFDIETPQKRPGWPFVLVSVLLLLLLAAQLAYHYRSEIVAHVPETADVYRNLNIDIPLSRQVELVAIEVSDLQSDNARGLLILHATLRNRAPFAQEWPVLELTLTDTNDEVVSRRILNAADYLPTKADKRAFAGNSEIGVKLWLESRQPAAGYRLFLFYP